MILYDSTTGEVINKISPVIYGSTWVHYAYAHRLQVDTGEWYKVCIALFMTIRRPSLDWGHHEIMTLTFEAEDRPPMLHPDCEATSAPN